MLFCAAIVVRLNVRGVRDVVKLIMYSWVSCLERQQLQKPNDEAGNEWLHEGVSTRVIRTGRIEG